MNLIEQLKDQLAESFPAARLEIMPPKHADGIWSLDVDLGEKKLAVEWSEATGFGLSTVRDDNIFEGADERLPSLATITPRINQLLISR